jgi:natural product precursor
LKIETIAIYFFNYLNIIIMTKLKLTNLSKEEMSKKQMNVIRGGGCRSACNRSRTCRFAGHKKETRVDRRNEGASSFGEGGG